MTEPAGRETDSGQINNWSYYERSNKERKRWVRGEDGGDGVCGPEGRETGSGQIITGQIMTGQIKIKRGA